jgi:signal transduction histidine kinase
MTLSQGVIEVNLGFLILTGLNAAGFAALVYYRRIQVMKNKQCALEAFSRKLIESQERERKRIATELHDSLGQELLVIKNQALLALRNGNSCDASHVHLEVISGAASQAIEEVRSIAYALRPYQLDRLGLTRAVESMVKRVAEPSGIRCMCRLDSVDGLFSKDSEIGLYRIVQEGVNNVVRHSGASEARVEMHRAGGFLSVKIADNGKGFHFEPDLLRETAGDGGLGLIGITERVQLLGGTSTIHSSPGAGTTINIRIRCKGAKDESGDQSDGRGRSSGVSKGLAAHPGL